MQNENVSHFSPDDWKPFNMGEELYNLYGAIAEKAVTFTKNDIWMLRKLRKYLNKGDYSVKKVW